MKDAAITCHTAQEEPTWLAKNAKLIRKAASGNTAPVVHIKGNYSLMEGGTVWSENNSPNGVVCCGHLDIHASNWNSLYWEFKNCWVYCRDFGGGNANPYPGDGDGIGVYIPSSEPQLGSNSVNYFGTLQNISVQNATTAFMLTDLANGHSFFNCTFRGFYWYGFRLHGAYGNSFYGGFLELGHKDGVVAIWLAHKLAPNAPHVSTLETTRNHFSGFTMELSTNNDVGVQVSTTLCTNNYVQFAWNTHGTAVSDPFLNRLEIVGCGRRRQAARR